MAGLIRFHPFPLIGRPPWAEKIPSKIRLGIEALNRKWRRAYLRKILGGRDFSIVACNCWGAGIYQDLDRPFNSPFIGLYLHPACFLKYIAHYDRARTAPLRFIGASRYVTNVAYPVGLLLDDIEIHFVHYATIEEASDKWQRRSRRLPENPDDAYFMLGVGSETVEQKKSFARFRLKAKSSSRINPRPASTTKWWCLPGGARA